MNNNKKHVHRSGRTCRQVLVGDDGYDLPADKISTERVECSKVCSSCNICMASTFASDFSKSAALHLKCCTSNCWGKWQNGEILPRSLETLPNYFKMTSINYSLANGGEVLQVWYNPNVSRPLDEKQQNPRGLEPVATLQTCTDECIHPSQGWSAPWSENLQLSRCQEHCCFTGLCYFPHSA